jgi:hypothetical protein
MTSSIANRRRRRRALPAMSSTTRASNQLPVVEPRASLIFAYLCFGNRMFAVDDARH